MCTCSNILSMERGCTSEEAEVDQFIMLIKAAAKTNFTTVTTSFFFRSANIINEICVTFVCWIFEIRAAYHTTSLNSDCLLLVLYTSVKSAT